MTLKSKLTLVVLIAIAPGFLVSIYAIVAQFRAAERRTYDAVEQAVRVSVRRNTEHITGTQTLMQSAVGQATGMDADLACGNLRALLPIAQPATVRVAGVADVHSDVLCEVSARLPHGERLPTSVELAIAAAARTRTFAVGGYDIATDRNESLLAAAYPFRARDGRPLFLFAQLPLTWFATLAFDLRLPPGSAVTVLDDNAVIRARFPDPQLWIGRTVADGPLFRLITGPEQQGSGAAAGVDGVQRLYAFAPLTGAGPDVSYVAVGIPAGFAFSEARETVRRALIGLLAAATFGLIMSRVVADRAVLRNTRALTSAAQRLAGGDLGVRIAARGNSRDDMTQLACAFNDMAASIERAHELAERRYGELRAQEMELRAAWDTLDRQRERLDMMSRELLRAQEKERQHIARELHDEIGQNLTALNINLQIEKSTTGASPVLEESSRIIDRILKSIRELSLELRPPLLNETGLQRAVAHLMESEAQRTGMHIDCHIALGEARFTPDVELAVFRIAQEAMTNILRHANADAVIVSLQYGEGALNLSIRDNGKGFDLQNTLRGRNGFGLLGMQERAVLAGGQFQVESTPGGGTTITVRVPIEPVLADLSFSGIS